MSTLVVVGYEGPCKADAALLKLRRLQREYLLDLEDAPIAIKDRQRKAQLNHLVNLTAGGCDPWRLPGLAHWPDLPAITGALTDVGINDHFMKELAATLIPSSSALFALTRSPSPDRDRLLEELKGLGGKILMTSLSHEDEGRLQAALSAAKSAGP